MKLKSNTIFAAFVIALMLSATFTVFSVHAATTRIFLDPVASVYTTDTAHVGDKFNVTIMIENAPNVGGAQVYLEFNDTILQFSRWFEPKADLQYIFYGKTTSALPTPPLDASYANLGPNRGKVLISVSMFPPTPPFFTGNGKICIFEFSIAQVPTSGKYTSAFLINTSDTYVLDGDTSSEIAGVVKENGSYEISKIAAPPKTFTLTMTATPGGTTDPPVGPHEYLEGTVVSVKAFNNSGYLFDHWKLDGVKIGSNNPVDVTMDKNHTLQAVFARVLPVGNKGDIWGPGGIPDGKVDLYDVFKVAQSFVSYGPDFLYAGSPPHPKWYAPCDLNGDNKVDLIDLFIVWKLYGTQYS